MSHFEYGIEGRLVARQRKKWMVSDYALPAYTREAAQGLCNMWALVNPLIEYRWVEYEQVEKWRGEWPDKVAASPLSEVTA
jgi:hypothetical protein